MPNKIIQNAKNQVDNTFRQCFKLHFALEKYLSVLLICLITAGVERDSSVNSLEIVDVSEIALQGCNHKTTHQ